MALISHTISISTLTFLLIIHVLVMYYEQIKIRTNMSAHIVNMM